MKIKAAKNQILKNKFIFIMFCLTFIFSLSGCVNQHPDKKTTSTEENRVSESDNLSAEEKETSTNNNTSAAALSSMLDITDKSEKAAVEAAKEKVENLGRNPRIIATSPATADICDKLNIDLVGVCSSTVSTLPSRYKNVKKIGTAMSPDMELVSSVKPDWLLSPSSLQSDLQPKYKAIDTQWAFLNLKSVQGMYRSIQELGIIFDREKEADKLVNDFISFYKEYKKENKEKKHPKVLVLMGLPGSYIIATPNSYVGNLVELAGGENVYNNTKQEFLTVNTEDMKKKEPDVILRAAHAMPEQVIKMFNDEFKTNDIWKHFEAVKNNKVYDLSYDKFGMSATFKYKAALKELKSILYK